MLANKIFNQPPARLVTAAGVSKKSSPNNEATTNKYQTQTYLSQETVVRRRTVLKMECSVFTDFRLIWFFPVKKSIDGADFSLVVLVVFYSVIAVECFYFRNGVVELHIAAEISWYRFKLIVRISCVDVE